MDCQTYLEIWPHVSTTLLPFLRFPKFIQYDIIHLIFFFFLIVTSGENCHKRKYLEVFLHHLSLRFIFIPGRRCRTGNVISAASRILCGIGTRISNVIFE